MHVMAIMITAFLASYHASRSRFMTSHSSLQDFDNMEKIGKGTFGTVFKCRRKKDGGIYVLKELSLMGSSGDEVQSAINECNILSSIESDYVTRYYDSFIDNQTQSLWLVMQYAQHGTLRDIIVKSNDYMSETDAWYYMAQMIIGVASLHGQHIIHRDIKSLNIFAGTGTNGHKYTFMIGDMGVSKKLNSTTFMSKTLVGSPYYLSPEICSADKYNMKSDIWALGVTFYEMLNKGKHPFQAKSQTALLVNIIKAQYPPLPAVYSKQLIDVVRWCLQKDPARRPDIFTLIAITPIQQVINQHKMQMPQYVQDGAKEALQRLQRIKTAEMSRSRMQSERASQSSVIREPSASEQRVISQQQKTVIQQVQQQQPPQQITHSHQPSAKTSGKQASVSKNTQAHSAPVSVQQNTEPAVDVDIESDVIVVDNDIQEFQDDFDDEEVAINTKQSTINMKTDNKALQTKLNDLLNDDQYLLTKFEDCVKEISTFSLPQAVRDQLVKWFTANPNASQAQVTEFVFKLIPSHKIGIVNHLRQYAQLMQQRTKLQQEINDVMNQIV